LSNYYEILGVQTSAGIEEIKSAFRRLAKLYHPDRNPAGNESFEKVLRAYETLSDPSLKSAYDHKLKYGSLHKSEVQKEAKTKNWRFDERELKRRQYYEQHIKKHAKTTESFIRKTEEKPKYNEFRYILYATPLAVALFLLIMNLATPKKKLHRKEKEPAKSETIIVPAYKNGATPYDGYFGAPQHDTITGKTLTIKNMAGRDAVVCLFNDRGMVRNVYIEKGFEAKLFQLPSGTVHIRYTTGTDFAEYAGTPVTPRTFVHMPEYYGRDPQMDIESINELNLLPGESDGFRKIGKAEFFSKSKQ
jgi:hypothetical protein